jgi:hypothetical protein
VVVFRLRLPLRGEAARRRDETEPLLPSFDVVCDILDEFGLTHSTDNDGDLLVRWQDCTVFFFFYGERQEVLQARLYLDRRFTVDERGPLALLLDEWNRTKLYPKAYTVLPDNGVVGVCAEHCFDFEKGTTREQLKYSIGLWLETLLRFSTWVDKQIP